MNINLKSLLKKIVKGYLRDIYWNLYGKTINNPDWIKNPESMIFICKGNICRSPFAHYIAQKEMETDFKNKITIDSAGLDAKPSNRSPANAVLTAKDFGVNLGNHIPKSIEQNMFEGSSMIIAMETWHFHTLKKRFPESADKIFLFPLFENDKEGKMRGFYRYNIEDPYGKNLYEFKKCFQRIERCVAALLEEIEKKRINYEQENVIS
jgi:protein-tyrosine phosphatase